MKRLISLLMFLMLAGAALAQPAVDSGIPNPTTPSRPITAVMTWCYNGSAVAACQPGSVTASIAPFTPTGIATLSASSSSSRVALGSHASSDTTVLVWNIGAVAVNFALGDNTVTATTSSVGYVGAGTCATIVNGSGTATDLAAITASGSTTLVVQSGSGQPIGCGGGGGGSGGAVTQDDLAATFSIDATSTTCTVPSGGAGCVVIPLGSGQNTVKVQLLGLTASGATITPKRLISGGTYQAVQAVQLVGGGSINLVVNTITVDGKYSIAGAPADQELVLAVTTAGTGTITGGYVASVSSPFDAVSALALQQLQLALGIIGTPGTWALSADVETWAGVQLGAMANYGTSPGAVKVPGVNASITNTPAVTCALCALEAGGNLATVATNTGNTATNTSTTATNTGTVAGAVSASVMQENLKQVNGVTVLTGTGATGTGAQRVTVATDTATLAGSAPGTAGTASANVVTVQGIGSMTKLLVTPDSVALPPNQSVNMAQIGGTNTVNGGVAGTQGVGGTVATNVAITANPLNLGAQAVSSENTAVTTARQVQLVADLVGKLIVLPYANPENFVSGVITSAMTGTTSTSLIAAPASGLRNYITQCTFSNSHATVGTDIILQDGSGGTTIYLAPAAPAFGGATITFPVPLRQPTTATALYVANVTTGANTKVACSGYKGS